MLTYEFDEMTWEEAVMAGDAEPVWLIDGILSDGTTLILGEPKAGKSFLTAAIIAALTSGEPFAGKREVEASRSRSVALAWTDDKAYREYTTNIRSALADGQHDPEVSFYRMPIMRNIEMWEALLARVAANGNDVLVIDNMTEALNGSLKDDDTVREFFDGVRLFVNAGIPVVIVYHSSEKRGEYGKSRTPLGSTLIAASVRWIVFLDRQPDDRTVRLICWGNAAREQLALDQGYKSQFTITDEMRAGEASQAREAAARDRSIEKFDRNRQYAEFVVKSCQGLGTVAAAEKLEEAFPECRANSYKVHLRPTGPIGSLLTREGSGTATTWRIRDRMDT